MSVQPDLLKIGDFAKLANTNLRTLRYYEELGLIQPATRSQGGFRYYRHTDIHRVQMIRDLQELGLHLDRIRELMAVLEGQRKKVAQALHKANECRHCSHSPGTDNNYCEPCCTTGEHLPDHLSALFQ